MSNFFTPFLFLFGSNFFNDCYHILEILNNVSREYRPIIHRIGVWTTNKTWFSDDQKWKLIPTYPMCQTVYFQEYFDLGTLQNKSIDTVFVFVQFSLKKRGIQISSF